MVLRARRLRRGAPVLPAKPPYRVPTLAEVRALPPNGLRVVSLFSGAGGSCLGFRMAGYRVVWASEFVPAARATYLANFPDVPVDARDVREVRAAEILDAAGLRAGEVDVLEGSPPCASYSMAGDRERGWNKVRKYSDTEQRVDDLFAEYVRLLRGVRPRAFVAENVGGLLRGVARGAFKEVLSELRESGYRVGARLLDAQWLGVPQKRQRVIFVGVREDLGVEPPFPRPLPYRYSIRDAIPWVDSVAFDTGGQNQARDKREDVDEPVRTIAISGQAIAAPYHFKVKLKTWKGERSVDEPLPTVQMHGRRATRNELLLAGEAPPPSTFPPSIAREARKLGPGQQSGRYFNLVRPRVEDACPTITTKGGTGAASVIHPTEPRKFTIAELRRLCSFPDDFSLTGSYQQQWERLGRAVPPLMMFRIAVALRDGVLLPHATEEEERR